MPKFNVLLKDDKTYPYIKVTVKEEFPRAFTTRKVLNDGARYFEPYASSGATNEMLDFIRSRYQIRQCKIFKSRTRPCLNYQIKKCSAPCSGKISKQHYMNELIFPNKIMMKEEIDDKELLQEWLCQMAGNIAFEKSTKKN